MAGLDVIGSPKVALPGLGVRTAVAAACGHDPAGRGSARQRRPSLPYAWDVIAGLVTELEAADGEFADNQVPPPDEPARGQLLRLMASDAMRAAIERRYGVRLAFQNCHRAAVFRPAAVTALAEFTSARAQLLNQRQEFVNC